MTDNIFDRLLELLQAPGPVNWKIAAEVAHSLSGPPGSIDPAIVDEYRQLVRTAEMHVAQASPLSPPPSGEAQVTDRRAWADANLHSFAYLVEPLADKLAEAPGGESGLQAVLKPLGPVILGMQMGAMVGFMSHRVLGGFDAGLPVMDGGGPSLVASNIETFARDHEIEVRQARLWAALHEVVFRAILGIDWVRPHFVGIIEDFFEGLDLDPEAIASRLEGLDDPEELERLMADPAGMASLLTGPHREEALTPVRAFMALMEGYADYVMDLLAAELIPEAPRLREAINRRRAEPSQGEKMLQQLVGLELKRMQYQLGSAFCREVNQRWGEEALAKVWADPDYLPTMAELEDPISWAARVLVDQIGTEPGEA